MFDWDSALDRLEELNALAESPALWDDAEKAQDVMRERQEFSAQVDTVRRIETALSDNIGLIALGEEENDADIVAEAESAIAELSREAARLQVETLLSGEA
ncbi:MAG: PCRF domain-containing protein, partial [Nitratireductor sp.]|nr:PCRF domain-containing protein [Nitratireductor sp.]